MRVLWLTHFVPYPPTGHGALQRTHHLLLQSSAEHEIGLIALAPSRHVDADALLDARSALSSHLAFCDLHPITEGPFRFHRRLAMLRAVTGEQTYWERWLFRADVLRSLAERVASFRPDLIHFDSLVLSAYIDSVREVPFALTHHNIESDLYAQRASLASNPTGFALSREARKLRHLEQLFARKARVNITVSTPDAERLHDIAPGACVSVVPNGVDTTYFRPIEDAVLRPKSLVFVGGMDWYPNRIAMEWFGNELWPRLSATDPDRTAVVVGRQPPPSLLRAASQDARLEVTGFVSDVRPIVSSSATYVCPIKVGGGTRLKILDALAMARPLVSTALGVSGLGLTPNEHYLQAESVDDFVHQVQRLEQDPHLQRRIARAGRAFVEERYSWTSIGGLMSAALRTAITSHPAAV